MQGNAVVSVRSGYGLLMLLSICCSDCHYVSLTRFHSMRGVNMTAGSAKTQAPKARKRVDVDPSLLKRSIDGSAFTRWYEHNLVALLVSRRQYLLHTRCHRLGSLLDFMLPLLICYFLVNSENCNKDIAVATFDMHDCKTDAKTKAMTCKFSSCPCC